MYIVIGILVVLVVYMSYILYRAQKHINMFKAFIKHEYLMAKFISYVERDRQVSKEHSIHNEFFDWYE